METTSKVRADKQEPLEEDCFGSVRCVGNGLLTLVLKRTGFPMKQGGMF